MGDAERDELIDLARRGSDALERGDLDAVRPLIRPDAEFHFQLAASEGRFYRGIEGLEQYVRDLEEAFETVERETLTMERVAESVVVVSIRVRAVGRGSGIEIDDVVFWAVMWFEDGLVRRMESFRDRDSAYAAARE